MSVLDITCANLTELVTDYIEHALPPDASTIFEAHLVFCSDCRSYLGQVRETISQLAALRGEEVDPVERDIVLEAFQQGRR